jgi:hypothetical protein
VNTDSDYEELQSSIRQRLFCIGWRQEDSQAKNYYQALFDDWHEANAIACGSVIPGYIPFVEAVTETIKCPRCHGSGDADRVGKDHNCTYCHGRGKVRKP